MVSLAKVALALCLLIGKQMCLAVGTVHEVSKDTCKDGAVAFELPAERDSVAFKCISPLVNLNPSDPQYVFKNASAPQESRVKLSGEISGAILENNKPETGENTLTVSFQHKPSQPVELTYICQQEAVSGDTPSVAADREADQADPKFCKVTITVAAKSSPEQPEQEPSEQSGGGNENNGPTAPKDVYECSPDKATEITVSEPRSDVKMKCTDSLVFQPEEKANAFDAGCESVKSLSSLVPGAGRHDEEDIHILSIPRLPEGSKSMALCYQCRPAANLEGKNAEKSCQFKITVKPASSADSGVGGVRDQSTSFSAAAVVAATFAIGSL
ncbi:hypothetical protein BESB_038380 [Besnoitia besnoiti]|uniref:SRS domain-containing protein n=1 Tax=Besnoitia besnoiti TaxID=94643 RepID=A0A2A9MNS2_BESBE|nr:hypothetical protein BESB_038380 [Besnoitia besnoiti]PFH37380.1 hypothetical protein BESB_038380 [Besnoitia besnoiti]